jgi:hypothetical protein
VEKDKTSHECYNASVARGKNKAVRSPQPKSKSLEELIRAQGIKPISDLDELGASFPEDFDPDAFRAFIEAGRAARRTSRPRRKTGSYRVHGRA